MSPSQAMIDSSKRGPYDELNTPAEAFGYIEPYCLSPIWECAAGEGRLVRAMVLQMRTVVTSHTGTNPDFLIEDPPPDNEWNMICTNPPFSKKSQFLARCNELKKPWALLLPITTLGARNCQIHLDDAEIVFLPRRIDFTGKGRPWFAVAWFTKGLKIGRQMTFSK